MTSVEKCTGATLGHTQSHVSVVVVLPSLDSASLDVLYILDGVLCCNKKILLLTRRLRDGFSPNLHQQTSLWCHLSMMVPGTSMKIGTPEKILVAQNVHFLDRKFRLRRLRRPLRGNEENFFVANKVKVKEGHTPKERRRGAHLPFIGR